MQVAKVVRGQEPSDLACIETATPAPGSVAIAASSEAGWLVIGQDTWTSSADLTNWKQA